MKKKMVEDEFCCLDCDNVNFVIKLNDKIKKLKIALEFYKNEDNWRNIESQQLGFTNSDYCPVKEDRGKVARLALENIEKKYKKGV